MGVPALEVLTQVPRFGPSHFRSIMLFSSRVRSPGSAVHFRWGAASVRVSIVSEEQPRFRASVGNEQVVPKEARRAGQVVPLYLP